MKVLDWLDQRPALQFVTILYVARWLALVPVMVLSSFVFTEAQRTAASIPEAWTKGTPVGLLLGLVVVPPLLETLLECSVPYWIVSWVRGYRRKRPKRCWGFVAISACAMALLHPMPAAVLPSLITGIFLAYCYAHFAAGGTGRAIIVTAVFHGAINMVGWTMIVIA